MEKEKYILTVTLNPVIDKTVNIPQFRMGGDFREEHLSISAGGKGINVSQVLTHLRVKNVATGFLSVNGGGYIEEELECQKIPYDFHPISGGVRTSLTIIDPTSVNLTRIMERGPRVTLPTVLAFKVRYRKLLKNANAVILSGRNIPGAPHSLYGDLIRIAHEEGVISVFDTSGKPYSLGLKKKPFLIKPNIEEAEEVLGTRLRTMSEIKKAAIEFYRRGVKIVTITCGSKGAVVFDGKAMVYATTPKIKRINPVGCGDSFTAGFIAKLTSNKSIEECVRCAIACGSANALSIDPGTIDLKNVHEIERKIQIKHIYG